MVASDRLLVALAKYLEDAVDWVGLGLSEAVVPRVRDWEGSKSSFNVTLDLDEPTEHEVIDGVYSATGQIAIEMKAREISESIRREVLEAIEASLTQPGVILPEVLEWLNNQENDRGLGTEALEVYDLRSDSGGWNVEDDWFRGEVGIIAQFRGGLSLVDLSYYFFDAADFTSGAVNTWDGSVSGTNNLGLVATQTTSTDQPISYGPLLAFADQSDHFDIPATTQEGWQCVGTTKGCFAYKTNNNSISTLNLLGNEDPNGYYYRQTGGLFGIKLLPANSSTEQVEKVLRDFVNAGAEEKAPASLENFFRLRKDIVEFFDCDFSGVHSLYYTFEGCSNLLRIPKNLDTKNCTVLSGAFQGCQSLEEFPAIDTSGVTYFNAAWHNCQSLESFPFIDTSKGIGFYITWRLCVSLTSFPLLDFSSAVSLAAAWYGCSGLESFPLINSSNVTDFANAWAGCNSLTSFPAIDTSSGTHFNGAWFAMYELTSFPVIDCSKGRNFTFTWYAANKLELFPGGLFDNWNPLVIQSGVFNGTWQNCPKLSALSVGNILESIETSGKHATTSGESGGTPLADAVIDIDYDGTQLSQETTDAIATLSSRGWSVNLNGVIQ